MPIDPDAYMSGAIPTLSRGGGWLPSGSTGNSRRASDIDKPPSSPTCAPRASSGMSMDMFSGFWKSPMYGIGPGAPGGPVGSDHSKRFGSSRTVPPSPLGIKGTALYPSTINMSSGWAPRTNPASSTRLGHTMPSHAQRPTLHSRHSMPLPSDDTSAFTSSSSQHSIASPKRQTSSVPNSTRVRKGSEVWQGSSWEGGAGAPRPMTREPDYGAKSRHQSPYISSVQPHRRKAETLPSPPVPDELALAKKPLHETFDTRQHDHRLVIHSRKTSLDLKNTSHIPKETKRPSTSRRHTHQPLTLVQAEEDDLDPQNEFAPSTGRSLAVDHGSRSPMTRVDTTSRPPKLPHERSRSLTKIPLNDVQSPPTSPYIKLTRRQTRHSLQFTAPSHASPLYHHSSAGESRQRHVLMPHTSVPTAPSSSSPVPLHPTDPPAMDLSSLSSALPAISTPSSRQKQFPSPAIPRQAPLELQSPSNLGPRLAHEEPGYDPYSMHPAAPAPPRADRDILSTSITQNIDPPLSASTSSTAERSGTYTPIGYAGPTRPVAWNRDGPAMKTYGVAWKKHVDGLVLPNEPQGPRWIQARPPRSGVVIGGEWGQSGGGV
ncbi:hypothetical protein BD324DRAFT_448018 [Kockovaella imperatae]|uniref:Uncharacterized protein n=1 Tax=Kockovaella imperatae TaxID=4999 RepID=A0A1Y1UIT0_9TREE|nr:hypothetical protein BD324DRAFT_448018 [Kockovaella imperatae]ORX37404.1 hypothetical protein BD324DRAFT_448018 [Kockovaella imperatae]